MRQSVTSYLDALVCRARELPHKPVLFISSDEHCMIVNSNAERLQEHLAYSYLSQRTLRQCIDKHAMFEAAAEATIPVPATVFVSSQATADEALETMAYPCVVKPASWVQLDADECSRNPDFMPAFGQKAVRAASEGDLHRLLDKALLFRASIVVQQEIVGDCRHIWGVSLYRNEAGDTWTSPALQKTRQYPSDFGTGCCITPLPEPRIAMLAQELAKATDFRGIAEVEFKQHSESGDFYLMEINPRPGTWITVAPVNGVNTPFIAYCDLAGLPIPAIHVSDRPVIWVDSWYDALYFFRYRNGDHTGKRLSWAQWRKSLQPPREGAYFTNDDPLPGIHRGWDLGCALGAAGWRRIKSALTRSGRCPADPSASQSQHSP